MRGRIRGTGAKTTYEIDRGGVTGWVEVSKLEFDQAFPDKPIITGHVVGASVEWRKPILSDALAVHPDEIPQAEADAAKQGVPTEFARDGSGRPIFRSRKHRRDYMKTVGVHDRRGGYADG